MYPTPRACDLEGGVVKNVELKNGSFSRLNKKGVRFGVKLKDAVHKMYPTPAASDYHQRRMSKNWKGDDLVSKITKQAEDQGYQQPKVGGKLNQNFVEFLMGYAQDWTKIEPTELKHSETQSYRKLPTK
jgi:hypothetical protein